MRDFEALGKSAESMTPEEADTFVKSRPYGRTMLDIGRVLSEVELRGPDGTRLEYLDMSFLDIEEFRKYGRILGVNHDAMLAKLPPNTQVFSVSVRLRDNPLGATYRTKRLSNHCRAQ